ncbi:MAG TPA: hypothetical protein VFQ56_11095 [Flavobacterium sp.]|nr:hypothetical protein [Flavobacterium sp.]
MYQIILCEKATGIVLELDGKTRYHAGENNKRPSFSFDNLLEAENKAYDLINVNSDLEIAIYDCNWEYIKTITKE